MQLLRTNKNKRKLDDLDDEIIYIYDPKKRSINSNHQPLKRQEHQRQQQTFLIDHICLRPASSKFKLFDMCLEFIATNVECIESLHTLPSLVGEQIFNECIKLGKFNSDIYGGDLVRERLFVFASAYPDLVIESMNLSNQQDKSSLNYLLSIISNCSLIKLNLSNTKLKDSVLNLSEVLKKSQKTLVQLNLSENNIDEDFLQKFTVSQRLMALNFNKLQFIDLSLNYKLKSLDFLRYLTKFPSLSEIRVSVLRDETVFVCSTNQGRNPVDYFGFRICKCPVKNNEFSNYGWIQGVCMKNLISQEKIDIDSVTEYKMIQNKDESVRTTLKFYDKKVAAIDQAKIQLETARRLANLFRLITLKRECICLKTATCLPTKSTADDNNKLNVVKKKKLVNCPKIQLENLVIDNDLFKMYT